MGGTLMVDFLPTSAKLATHKAAAANATTETSFLLLIHSESASLAFSGDENSFTGSDGFQNRNAPTNFGFLAGSILAHSMDTSAVERVLTIPEERFSGKAEDSSRASRTFRPASSGIVAGPGPSGKSPARNYPGPSRDTRCPGTEYESAWPWSAPSTAPEPRHPGPICHFCSLHGLCRWRAFGKTSQFEMLKHGDEYVQPIHSSRHGADAPEIVGGSKRCIGEHQYTSRIGGISGLRLPVG